MPASRHQGECLQRSKSPISAKAIEEQDSEEASDPSRYRQHCVQCPSPLAGPLSAEQEEAHEVQYLILPKHEFRKFEDTVLILTACFIRKVGYLQRVSSTSHSRATCSCLTTWTGPSHEHFSEILAIEPSQRTPRNWQQCFANCSDCQSLFRLKKILVARRMSQAMCKVFFLRDTFFHMVVVYPSSVEVGLSLDCRRSLQRHPTVASSHPRPSHANAFCLDPQRLSFFHVRATDRGSAW